jgi:hypothetical protein
LAPPPPGSNASRSSFGDYNGGTHRTLDVPLTVPMDIDELRFFVIPTADGGIDKIVAIDAGVGRSSR